MRSGDGDKLQIYHHNGAAWSGPHLSIDPANGVGIGTNPSWIEGRNILHVKSELTPAFVLEQTTSSVRKWIIFTHAFEGGLIFRDGENDRVYINPDGRVGIGKMNPASALDVNGDIRFTGNLIGGGKGGYVMDQFVNKIGETLEQGDVIVIGRNQSSLYYGPDQNIPIPEVDLAKEAYDTRVCGIVCEIYTELKPVTAEEADATGEKITKRKSKTKNVHLQAFTPEELARTDKTKIEPEQIGWMVTLGAFAHCKVDADIAPIKVGDLLTTSPTKGHAQKVLAPEKAVGAVIGKALGSLKKGKGKIPILVTLH
jgi:hypothetical protein